MMQTEEAFYKMADLLKEEYDILNFPPELDFVKSRWNAWEDLRKSIDNLFKQNKEEKCLWRNI